MTEHIVCIEDGYQVEPLLSSIERQPELWTENTWRQDYVTPGERPVSPQRNTEAIMFRWAPENTIESVRDSLQVVSTKNIDKLPEVANLVVAALVAIEATECGRVFIAKLKPGGVVDPHYDYGMYSDHFERFHLVLQSDPGNTFSVGDGEGNLQEEHMRPGQLFWFNHKEVHWAVNGSDRPRMHLIIDAVAPKWRKERKNYAPILS